MSLEYYDECCVFKPSLKVSTILSEIPFKIYRNQENMCLQFEFPVSLTAEKFIAKLSKQVETQLISRQYSLKTYYDSFDWRLYGNGLTCEFNRSKTTTALTLRSLENNLAIAGTDIHEVPAFSKQFQPGKIRITLEPILEMRALLSVCTLDYEAYRLNIINKDKKTVVRLFIEEHELLNNRLTLQTIKGYDKTAEYIIEILTDQFGLSPTDQPVLLTALALQGRQPNDYSSKLLIHLDPIMRADLACKIIYKQLLKVIKANEQGTINDTDSEFLHDFRVAVRKTRSGLSQLKGVLPDPVNAYYADFFSWLGQITGPTRDLDVYLLNFELYKSSLPISIREDINPLYDFLLDKQRIRQRELAKHLKSRKYLTTLAEWTHYLEQRVQNKPIEPNAGLTIKQLADSRIWKVYKRVIREGDAISELSESEKLHDLRKSCKKLRYLIEFFQSLYPDNQIRHLLRSLKELQEVLGDFQDYQVQENNLKEFSEEMLADKLPASTVLAMGVLIQNLDARRDKARNEFNSRFSAFRQAENQAAFKSLFAAKP